MRSSLALRLLVPASLVLLVATLATLQYHWLGQVSEAERNRLRVSLSQRASEFADDFDREIVRLYLSLQVEGTSLDRGDWTAFARSYDTWREAARFPEMLRAVYLVNGSAPETAPRKYDPDTHTFVAASWPASLAPVTERLAKISASSIVSPMPPPPPPAPPAGTLPASRSAQAAALDQLRHFVTGRDPIVASVPALIVSLPTLTRSETTGGAPSVTAFKIGPTVIVAELDAAYLADTMLPTLAARYFPERDADTYRFAVVDMNDQARPVYERDVADGARIDASHADAMVPLFTLRPELAPQVAGRTWLAQSTLGTFSTPVATLRSTTGGRQTVSGTSVSIFVESRGTSTNDVIKFTALNAPWQLRLQHTAGSLDAAVGAARRRNLWLSFGILTVLAASVILVVLSAQRWQRLAAQQMDFVATVSHELRTPLTVIRSAAQNLSAGVVHDRAQARQYGDLIETEGRRLTDMVEQVLEYAGLSGNRPLRTAPVDMAALVHDVVASSASLLDAEHIEATVDVPADLPPIEGDEDALRRALQNLIGNAVKYGSDGQWIGVTLRRTLARGGDELQIAVSDRGRGIDADDLAHIFEPFYRGRYAIEHQIHGNGLGLSLVRRIAEAHGGRVTVTSTPGTGTTFTITLPAPIRLARSRRKWSQSDPNADAHPTTAESRPATH
jgi:signal transduction histidine kinase